MRKIKVWIETGVAGHKHVDYIDLPDGWDEMTAAEQDEELNGYATCHLNNHINYGACVVDDEEDED